jgi:multiple sugar transport system permease protein
MPLQNEISEKREKDPTAKWGPLLLLPSLVFLGVVIFYPLIYNFITSLTNQNLFGTKGEWQGLGNYLRVLRSGDFWLSLNNGLVLSLSTTALTLFIGFCIALLLNKPMRGKSFFSGILLFPYVIPSVVAAFIFHWLFNDLYGLFNYVFMKLGVIDNPIALFGSPSTAMPAVILVNVWRFFPFVLIVILARLQNIPQELYDSAKVDGANWFQQLRYVTLPQLRSVFFLVIILRTIWVFNNFDMPWLLTQGGPAGMTQTLPILAYLKVFKEYRVGLGASVTIMMFLFLLGCSIIYFRIYKFEKSKDENV